MQTKRGFRLPGDVVFWTLFVVIIGLFFAGMGALLLYRAKVGERLLVHPVTWIKVEGKVFDVVVRPVLKRGERLHYSGGIWYEFAAREKRFRKYVEIAQGNTAEDVRAGVPKKGAIVTIHYDAADPENSSLTPWRPKPDWVRETRTAGFAILGGGGFFVMLGGSVLGVYGWRARKEGRFAGGQGA